VAGPGPAIYLRTTMGSLSTVNLYLGPARPLACCASRISKLAGFCSSLFMIEFSSTLTFQTGLTINSCLNNNIKPSLSSPIGGHRQILPPLGDTVRFLPPLGDTVRFVPLPPGDIMLVSSKVFNPGVTGLNALLTNV